MKRQHHISGKNGWKSWQLSCWFILSLIITAVAVSVAIEALVQVGNVPLEESVLRSKWLAWYCKGLESQNCIDLPTNLPFRDSSSSKSGIFTFLLPDAISSSASFVWLYFPTILAVTYAIFWQMVDAEVKRIEPFYQTQRCEGATAASSLFATYISLPPIFAPLQALWWRHTAVFLSSATYVLVGFVTPILQSQMLQTQSQFIQVKFADKLSVSGSSTVERGQPFAPLGAVFGTFNDSATGLFFEKSLSDLTNRGKFQNVVYLEPTYARVQEAVLLLAAVTGSFLLWIIRRRDMTIKNSVSGLGTLASLTGAYADFVTEMASLTEAKDATEAANVEKKLGQKVVHLGSRTEGDSRYGFWFEPSVAQVADSPSHDSGQKACNPYLTLRLVASLGSFVYTVFMVSFIAGMDIDRPTEWIGDYMATANLENPITLAVSNLIQVSVVKSFWVVVEEHVMSLSQFRSLYQRPRAAFPVLARDYATVPIFIRTCWAIRDKEFVLACITIVSLLLEVGLTCHGIRASMAQGQALNVDVKYALQWLVFSTSFVMLFVGVKLMHIILKSYLVAARNPNTLGARLSYFCRSPLLLGDLGPIGAMDNEEIKAHLQSLPHKYSLGKVTCYSPNGDTWEVQAVERVADETTY